MNTTQSTRDRTNWAIDYDDVAPIRIRDPVAEALAVLPPGEPFVIDYRDVVMQAGHSCPTASGAYRLTQLGLDALYPDALPVRGEIAVLAGGPKDEASYGVTSRIVSNITGAAEEDGFGGLAGGYGGRTNLLQFDAAGGAGTLDDADGPTFAFRRTDTGDAVRVTYHASDVPDAGPATRHLSKLIDGTASAEERTAFAAAWHDRVRSVLTDDDRFTVERTDVSFPSPA